MKTFHSKLLAVLAILFLMLSLLQATPAAADIDTDPDDQTITFDALADKTWGDPDFDVSAYASSGLEVGFYTDGNCTSWGSTVSITGAGYCWVTAFQGGDSNYYPAPDVTQGFNIHPAEQTIMFDALADKTWGDPDFDVSAYASSGLGVGFYTSGTCASWGNTVSIMGVGPCWVTAFQGGDSNYYPAPDVTQGFNIYPAEQTITFDALADKTWGDPDFDVSAYASSGLEVGFYTSGTCVSWGNTVSIMGVGPCDVFAYQSGDGNYNPAPEVVQSFYIYPADQTITFDALADKTWGDPDFDVSASASSGLEVSFGVSGDCTILGNTIYLTGAGSCTVTASQGGDSNYNPAPDVVHGFNINKVDQTITFYALDDKTWGDPDFDVSASASSGLEVSFGVSGDCSIFGNTISITGAGHCDVTASQGGDSNYNPATDVVQGFYINKADQTITFGALENKTWGDPDFSVSASASSGLEVSFGVSGDCTILGHRAYLTGALSGSHARLRTTITPGITIHLTGAGSCDVTASQGGDSNYNPAYNEMQGFYINMADQTIAFDALADKTWGDPDFSVSATASSGLDVSFDVIGDCSILGNTVSISGAGSCEVTASQGGDGNYNPAPDVVHGFSIYEATQTIDFAALSDKTYGDPDFAVSATASSGLPVSFAVGVTDQCTILGSTIHLTGVGSCTVTASQGGDSNYNPATDVPQTFNILTAGPGAFSKYYPGNGATNRATVLTLYWLTSAGATSYEYCIDTSDNNDCNSVEGWVSTDANRTVALSGLAGNTTYSWQVRAMNADGGSTYADGGTWWSFTTVGCYTLTTGVSPVGGGSVGVDVLPNCAGGKYYAGTVLHMTATPAVGYAFTNWTGDAVGTPNPATLTITKNMTETANFTLLCYTLTLDVAPSGWGRANANPGPNCAGGKYTHGTVVQLTATAGTGYVFSNWSGGITSSANPAPVSMDANKSVTGNFVVQAPGAFVKYYPSNGATNRATALTLYWLTSARAASYEYCIDMSDNNDCNSVEGWVSTDANRTVALSGLAGNTTYFWQVRAVNSTDSIYADGGTWWSFTTTGCYTLTTGVSPVGGGSVGVDVLPNCAGGKYYAGTVLHITATPAVGHTFIRWTGDAVGTSNPGTLTITKNMTETANFTP